MVLVWCLCVLLSLVVNSVGRLCVWLSFVILFLAQLPLDTTKSSGPDGISAAMLKHTAGTIAPSLTKIFNLSICLGQIPSQLVAHWDQGRKGSIKTRAKEFI